MLITLKASESQQYLHENTKLDRRTPWNNQCYYPQINHEVFSDNCNYVLRSSQPFMTSIICSLLPNLTVVSRKTEYQDLVINIELYYILYIYSLFIIKLLFFTLHVILSIFKLYNFLNFICFFRQI